MSHRLRGEDLPERPRAAPAGKEAVQMAGVVMQALAPRQPRRDHGAERLQGLESVGDRGRLAKKVRVDADQELGF